MLYHSTNYNSHEVDFITAILQGQAFDKGLYMPNQIPKLNPNLIASLGEYSFQEIAIKIIQLLINDIIPIRKIEDIVSRAFNFDVPIEKFGHNNYICFLDRGPTNSFKDFGARFLARLLEYVLERVEKQVIILTATSGDTGGAVAKAFHLMKRIQVLVLYPKEEISLLQRKQMTTLGDNITAIGIEGKFDDCQRLVKRAFADKSLKFLNLSSANSINVGRLIPQSVYYFYSYSRVVKSDKEKVIFSVPSGNFGNLTAGLIANRMGLPVDHFIAAVNENDEFPKLLTTEKYQKVEPSEECISNAMNVGHPSNLARIFDLYEGQINHKGFTIKKPNFKAMKDDIVSYSISDSLTRETIINFYRKFNTIIEPHGAVGWAALKIYKKRYPKSRSMKAISFETADPAKFPEEIRRLIKVDPSIPQSLKKTQTKEEIFIHNRIISYQDFKEFLQNKYIE